MGSSIPLEDVGLLNGYFGSATDYVHTTLSVERMKKSNGNL